MANIIVAPSLSPQGWVSDSASKADILLSWFYESMHSQSYVYGNNVSSIQYILQQYSGDVVLFTQKLQDALELYLSRYYDLAIVSVSNNLDVVDLTNGAADISIYCNVTEGGITYSIGNLLKITNSKITSVSKLVNG